MNEENNRYSIYLLDKTKNFKEARFDVFERCDITEDKDEVKHPTYRKKILHRYNLI